VSDELTMVPTRQKQDVLWELPKSPEGKTLPIAAGAAVTLNTRLVEGYAELRFLAVMDQPFTIEVFEACGEDGTFVRTVIFASAAAVPASAGQMVCDRRAPCGRLGRLVVTNTGADPTTSQELCGSGLPIS
jgi:hypothetical protein